MDTNNQHLRELLRKTDNAFEALKDEPGSAERQSAYEQAKQELDHYVIKVREQLRGR